MREVTRIPLPGHPPDGEFDHAAVDAQRDRLYVAHPSNDAVEVIDLGARRYRESLSGLRGVAGVWVDPQARFLFTSNRGEDTASIFRLEEERAKEVFRVPTGVRPNGMAFDPDARVLMVAGVGDPRVANAFPTLTFFDAQDGSRIAQVPVPGRTRWGLYHAATESFYVNIADPPSVVAVRSGELGAVARAFPIPARGPHGLEQDPDGSVLYCACDDGVLQSLDVRDGASRTVGTLAGPPDVLWVDAHRGRLYCAVGRPGALDVFNLDPPRPAGRIATGDGAHTLTLDPRRSEVHVFLPVSHEDLVLEDRPDAPPAR